MGRLSNAVNGGKTGNSASGMYVGFDDKDIRREMEKAVKTLKRVHQDVTGTDVGRVSRRVLQPMVEAYKSEIKPFDTSSTKDGKFTVYRNGRIYAEISQDQLKESIGVIKAKVKDKSVWSDTQVGPLVKGKYSDPEKGGWFAHFLNFGGLIGGVPYRGANYQFADRAQKKATAVVKGSFITELRNYLNRKVKRHT